MDSPAFSVLVAMFPFLIASSFFLLAIVGGISKLLRERFKQHKEHEARLEAILKDIVKALSPKDE